MKAKYGLRSMSITVSVVRLKQLNIQRGHKFSQKIKNIKAYPSLLPKHMSVQQEVVGDVVQQYSQRWRST